MGSDSLVIWTSLSFPLLPLKQIAPPHYHASCPQIQVLLGSVSLEKNSCLQQEFKRHREDLMAPMQTFSQSFCFHLLATWYLDFL